MRRTEPTRPVSSLALGLLIAGLAVTPPAQVEGAPTDPPRILMGDWRVPIHASDAGAGPERWAGGSTYKASFHDGFVFYPVLGPTAPRHLPLRWQTVSVRAGETELLTGKATHAYEAWRYEYRHPQFTEAYDVRDAGVEQTFVVAALPGEGDLVVRGRFATELVAAPFAGRHQAIEFHDAQGRAVIEYGAATAIDAAGRRLPIPTSFDGEAVELRVPADWLRDATLPLVIDPLSRTVYVGSSSTPTVHTHLARGLRLPATLAICTAREVTSTDRDVVMWVRGGDFTGGGGLLYSDLGTADIGPPRVAYVEAGVQAWVIAYREIPPQSAGRAKIAVLPWLNPATVLTVPAAYGDVVSVSVGGSIAGERAMVGFVSRIAGATTSTWRVYGAVIDARARSIERYLLFQNVSRTSTEMFPRGVAVNALANHSVDDGWTLTWLESRSSLAGGYTLWAARGYADGRSSLALPVEISSSAPSGTPWRGDPAVDGLAGRYLIAFRVRNDQVYVRRVDWPAFTAVPQVGARRVHDHQALASTTHENTYDVAFDRHTTDHWALVIRHPMNTYRQMTLHRLGYTGGAVETVAFGVGYGTAPGICFDEVRGDFQIVSFSGTTTMQGLGMWLEHDPQVGGYPYGTACAGSISTTVPYAGRSDWRVQLTAAAFTPAALILGAQPASLPLDGGCFLNVDLVLVVILPATTNEFGIATVSMPLPDWPAFVGDVRLQWAHLAAGRLRTTAGYHAFIRP